MICRRCKSVGELYVIGMVFTCPDCGGSGRLHGPRKESAALEPDEIEALYDDAKAGGGEGG